MGAALFPIPVWGLIPLPWSAGGLAVPPGGGFEGGIPLKRPPVLLTSLPTIPREERGPREGGEMGTGFLQLRSWKNRLYVSRWEVGRGGAGAKHTALTAPT